MPTIIQLADWCRQELAKGKGELHTNHVTIIEEAAAERTKNVPDAEGKRKTRIAWDAADPDSYAEWHKERERWMKIAKNNPTHCTDAQIVALRLYQDEQITEILDSISETRQQAKSSS